MDDINKLANNEELEMQNNPNAAAEEGMNARTQKAEVNQKSAQEINFNAVQNAFNSLMKQNGGNPDVAIATMNNSALYKNFNLTFADNRLTIKPKEGTDKPFGTIDAFVAAQPGLSAEQQTALKGSLDVENADPAIKKLLPEILQMLHENPALQQTAISLNKKIEDFGAGIIPLAAEYQKDSAAMKANPDAKDAVAFIENRITPEERDLLFHLSGIVKESATNSGSNSDPNTPEHTGEFADLAIQAQEQIGTNEEFFADNPEPVDRERAAARVMMNYGVSVKVNEKDKTVTVKAPQKSLDKSINQFMGIILLISSYIKEIKAKLKEAKDGAAPDADPAVPKTAAELAQEAEKLQATELETEIQQKGKAEVIADINKKKEAPEKALNGDPDVETDGLNGEKAALEGKIRTKKANLQKLNAEAETPESKTEKDTLTADIKKLEEELPVLDEKIKKETDALLALNVKLKAIENLDKAKEQEKTVMNKNIDDMITESALYTGDPRKDVLVTTLTALKPLSVNTADKYQVTMRETADFTALTEEGIKLGIPREAFQVDGVRLVQPKQFMDALRKMMDTMKEGTTGKDAAMKRLTDAGANTVDAQEAARVEALISGVTFEYKNAKLSVIGDPKENAYKAWVESADDSAAAQALTDYMDKIIKEDLSSATGQYFLLKTCEGSKPPLDKADATQLTEISKTVPLLKDSLSFTKSISKDPGVIAKIKEHQLVKDGKLTVNLKAYWGI